MFCGISAYGQSSTSAVDILKLYSPNNLYYLISTPYSNVEECIYGVTKIYKTANDSLLYSIDRYFNYRENINKVNLSNNGQAIVYVNSPYTDDKVEEKRVLTFYVKGKLIKSYTVHQLITCNSNTEYCYPLYHDKEVIDSSKYANYIITYTFKSGTSDTDQFANSNNVFSNND